MSTPVVAPVAQPAPVKVRLIFELAGDSMIQAVVKHGASSAAVQSKPVPGHAGQASLDLSLAGHGTSVSFTEAALAAPVALPHVPAGHVPTPSSSDGHTSTEPPGPTGSIPGLPPEQPSTGIPTPAPSGSLGSSTPKLLSLTLL